VSKNGDERRSTGVERAWRSGFGLEVNPAGQVAILTVERTDFGRTANHVA